MEKIYCLLTLDTLSYQPAWLNLLKLRWILFMKKQTEIQDVEISTNKYFNALLKHLKRKKDLTLNKAKELA